MDGILAAAFSTIGGTTSQETSTLAQALGPLPWQLRPMSPAQIMPMASPTCTQQLRTTASLSQQPFFLRTTRCSTSRGGSSCNNALLRNHLPKPRNHTSSLLSHTNSPHAHTHYLRHCLDGMEPPGAASWAAPLPPRTGCLATSTLMPGAEPPASHAAQLARPRVPSSRRRSTCTAIAGS